jgi:hypothetical protein
MVTRSPPTGRHPESATVKSQVRPREDTTVPRDAFAASARDGVLNASMCQ